MQETTAADSAREPELDSNQKAAAIFMVDAQTIARWVREATREPDRKTVGSLLKATPPVRSCSDVTRELVAMLDRMRVGGCKKIAQMLVRAGSTISRETVRRYRKERPPLEPAPIPTRVARPALAVHAKGSNHVWMTDITNVPGLFGIWIFKLVVVLDVFSRFPPAFKVFSKEPSSAEIAGLVQEAADRYGKPRHFVADRGAQFTGEAFTQKLRELETKQRFGAIGQSGSIAVIERLWRTLKEMLDLSFRPPLSRYQLEERVAIGLDYYAKLRPHQGLGGATPEEIYFGLTLGDAHEVASPRATSRDPATPGHLPFEVAYADAARRMPYLIPRQRAA